MITKHLILGFTFGISISFISWIVGMIVNGILKKTEFYNKLGNSRWKKNSAANQGVFFIKGLSIYPI